MDASRAATGMLLVLATCHRSWSAVQRFLWAFVVPHLLTCMWILDMGQVAAAGASYMCWPWYPLQAPL